MLEKQYSRIIRWVHRAQAMSADGNFSDAILDVECARAELDDARQELLLCHKDGAPQRRIPKFLLVIPGAVFAVMIWAMPLCIEPDMTRFTAVPERTSASETRLAAAQTDKASAANMQEPLQLRAETVRPVLRFESPEVKQTVEIELSQVRDDEVSVSRGPAAKNVSGKRPHRPALRTSQRLSSEEVFRLTEVGRKALQGSRSSVVLEFN